MLGCGNVLVRTAASRRAAREGRSGPVQRHRERRKGVRNRVDLESACRPDPVGGQAHRTTPARQSRRPKAFSSGVTRIALVLPAAMTTTAVSSGTPPISRATPIAIGAVKDFGATQAISAA